MCVNVWTAGFFKVLLRLRIQMRESKIPHIKKSVKKKKSKTQQNLEIPQIMFSYNITIPDRAVISFLFQSLNLMPQWSHYYANRRGFLKYGLIQLGHWINSIFLLLFYKDHGGQVSWSEPKLASTGLQLRFSQSWIQKLYVSFLDFIDFILYNFGIKPVINLDSRALCCFTPNIML